MSWKELLIIKISEIGGLTLELGPLLILFILMSFWVWYRCKYSNLWPQWEVIETEISLGGIGKIKIKPSYEDIQIAHKAWVELATRKAGLPFDEEHDVIAEVYNSWYELFREMRALTKQIPADKVRNSEDTQNLLNLLVDALNKGLRPHLTQWQAKFRRWYEDALKESANKGKTPQQIQKEYSEYNALVSDLKEVNKELVEYTNFIREIAQGKK